MLVDGARLEVGASCGIALAPEHASEARHLLRVADAALYAAKRAGRNTVRMGLAVPPRQPGQVVDDHGAAVAPHATGTGTDAP